MIFIHAKKTFLIILYKSAAIKYNHTVGKTIFQTTKGGIFFMKRYVMFA